MILIMTGMTNMTQVPIYSTTCLPNSGLGHIGHIGHNFPKYFVLCRSLSLFKVITFDRFKYNLVSNNNII